MKLMWFHLMPYTELPEDFNQKHPSVWVDIHSSLFDPRRAHHMYNDFMDELEYAAELGFELRAVVRRLHAHGVARVSGRRRAAAGGGGGEGGDDIWAQAQEGGWGEG